jgi:alpha-D-ribose 1-methylphosphonate 5-triphosphate synthase subunit PhnI
MGYVAAKGGFDAIRAAEALVRRSRLEGRSSWLELDQIIERLGYAVDRIMGEGGLWDPETAARAFRQAEGDVIEAAHLVRAHRAALPRLGYTQPVDADEIDVVRRIVPAFRQPPGPQLLGRTLDYTGRILDTTPEDEARRAAVEAAATRHAPPVTGGGRDGGPLAGEGVHNDNAPASSAGGRDGGRAGEGVHNDNAPASSVGGRDGGRAGEGVDNDNAPPAQAGDREPRVPGRLLDALRQMDAVVDRRRADDPEPVDISRVPARPGSPRSSSLSSMARAETGALVQLWYRNILGPDRHLHEVTLGEVRHGRLPVSVEHPLTGRPVTIGTVRVTEVEAIEDLDGSDEDRTRFDVGYGMCFGHNERKAIAMANLDIALTRDQGASALEQSVLMTTDGLDASGFLEHLKLPHYVTFRSMMERKEALRSDRVATRLAAQRQGRSDCEVTDLSGGAAAPDGRPLTAGSPAPGGVTVAEGAS